MGAVSYLWQQLRGARAPVAAMGGALAARIGLILASPWLVGRVLDGVERHEPLSRVEPWVLLVLAAALLTPTAAYMAGTLAYTVEWTVANRLRVRLAARALTLPVHQHRTMTPGALVERVDGDVAALGALLSNLGLQVVGSAGQALAALGGLWLVNRSLGLIVAGLVALVAWALERVRRATVPLVEAERQSNADTYGLLGELLAAKDDVAAEGAAHYAQHRLAHAAGRWQPHYVRAELSAYVAWALLLGAFGFADGATYLVSGHLYFGAHVPLGTVYMLVAYMGLLAAPLSSLREQIAELQRGQGSLRRVMTWDHGPAALPAGRLGLPSGPLALTVSRVSWRHDGARGVHDVSFTLAPGRHLAVVGASGAGKSTLAMLVAHFADPEGGTIHLGGIALRQVDPGDLRRRVAYLPQTPALFAASLLDNVTLFDPTIPTHRAAGALAAMGLGAWADRLNQPLDPSRLSAGERELLALARIWLGDPGLIILDEPLSRLDRSDRGQVAHAWRSLLAGRTAVIISHRLATLVADAPEGSSGASAGHSLGTVDDVLVLDEGRVVEHGSLARLLQDPMGRFGQLLAAERAADGERPQ